MFHVEPTVRALVLGAFLSAGALAQTDAGQSGSADAGIAAPVRPQPPAKKRRTSKKGTAAQKAGGGGPARTSKAPVKRDPRIVGLGRGCTKRADCGSAAQICLRQTDQRGKAFARGVCALPCAGLEQGLTKTRPGFPARDPQTTEKILKVPPPPRCPLHYQCRSKGGSIPVDLCVRG
jgi:hypothetical protein